MHLFELPWISGWHWFLISLILALITFCIIIAVWDSNDQLQINQQWHTNEEKKKMREYMPSSSETLTIGENVATLWVDHPLPDPVPFPVVMPNRYVIDAKYNMSQAINFFAETLEWRRDQGMDKMIIFKEKPFFHAVRSVYPHFLNGRSKQVQTSIIDSICTCKIQLNQTNQQFVRRTPRMTGEFSVV